MEFHQFLSHALTRDPELAEKLYHHLGGCVTRYLIEQWAQGYVVPAPDVQDRIRAFVRQWSGVRFLYAVDGG